MRHLEEAEAVFPHEWWLADGALNPGDAPGLGVDIDEDLAAEHPHEPASLPVNRARRHGDELVTVRSDSPVHWSEDGHDA